MLDQETKVEISVEEGEAGYTLRLDRVDIHEIIILPYAE